MIHGPLNRKPSIVLPFQLSLLECFVPHFFSSAFDVSTVGTHTEWVQLLNFCSLSGFFFILSFEEKLHRNFRCHWNYTVSHGGGSGDGASENGKVQKETSSSQTVVVSILVKRRPIIQLQLVVFTFRRSKQCNATARTSRVKLI